MAQTGFTPILTYNSATATVVPSAGNLLAGELALNTTDGKMYFKNTGGVVTLLSSATAITDPVISSLNGGQLAGLRNRIINGDMRIDQRNSGAAVTPAASTYLVDRFGTFVSTASKLTFQQVSDAPAGLKLSTKITVSSQYAPSAADFFLFYHLVEGQSIVDFQFGLSSAAAITLSNQIKGSVAGNYSVSLRNSAGTRSYVGTVSVTTSWAPVKITLAGDITGTWLTDNATGLNICFDLGSGTNSNGAANTWQSGNFLRTAGSVTFVNQVAGSTLNITGVQLELGTVATSFEQRPIGLELSLCQRYYTTGDARFQTSVSGVGNNDKTVPVFKSTMRISPTVSLNSITSSGYGTPTATEIVISNFSMIATATGAVGGFVNSTYVASAEL